MVALNINKWNALSLSLSFLLSAYFIVDILIKKLPKKSKPLKKRSSSKKLLPHFNLLQKDQTLPFHSQSKFLYIICFSGGPCGGKTKTIDYISEKLSAKNINVLKIEETPTMTVKCGGNINLGAFSRFQLFGFFTTYMNFQMEIENIHRNIAETIIDGPTVILCDRGIHDAWAYCNNEIREIIKNQFELNEEKILNMRYDCTIHMLTSADGAEKFYSLADNVARHETAEQAKNIDYVLQEKYFAHKNFNIVENDCGSFEEKMECAYQIIERQIFAEKKKKWKKFEVEVIEIPKGAIIREYNKTKHLFKNGLESVSCLKFEGFSLYYYHRKNEKDGLKYRKVLNKREFTEILHENLVKEQKITNVKKILLKNKVWKIYRRPDDEKAILKSEKKEEIPFFFKVLNEK